MIVKFLVATVCLFVGLNQTAMAAEFTIPASKKPLFTSQELLDFRLEAPFTTLFKAKESGFLEARKTKVQGKIVVAGREIPVTIRMRGYSSLGYCTFPKLMLKIDKEAAKGTVFEGTGKLDLGTHCQDPADVESTRMIGPAKPHREALLYRWLGILGIPAYASRAARATYVDTDAALSTKTFDAALFEHLSALLKRAGAREIRPVNDSLHERDPQKEAEDDDGPKYVFKGLEHHPEIDLAHLAKIEIYEGLIGNSDFNISPSTIWNLKLLETPGGKWEFIPLDFNLSSLALGNYFPALMNNPNEIAHYSALDDGAKSAILDLFLSKRTEIMATLKALDAEPEAKKGFTEALTGRFDELAKKRADLGH